MLWIGLEYDVGFCNISNACLILFDWLYLCCSFLYHHMTGLLPFAYPYLNSFSLLFWISLLKVTKRKGPYFFLCADWLCIRGPWTAPAYRGYPWRVQAYPHRDGTLRAIVAYCWSLVRATHERWRNKSHRDSPSVVGVVWLKTAFLDGLRFYTPASAQPFPALLYIPHPRYFYTSSSPTIIRHVIVVTFVSLYICWLLLLMIKNDTNCSTTRIWV